MFDKSEIFNEALTTPFCILKLKSDSTWLELMVMDPSNLNSPKPLIDEGIIVPKISGITELISWDEVFMFLKSKSNK